ncbi:uncharacterized protein LOC143225383 isoform X3 [Tachypleus tridentatus]|uniref:uncharacterized protein LOC143225383 isoform X3 n=1 Tax=Tachypleus tridentatus TaxID=6853 RepID=UPI003FD2B609
MKTVMEFSSFTFGIFGGISMCCGIALGWFLRGKFLKNQQQLLKIASALGASSREESFSDWKGECKLVLVVLLFSFAFVHFVFCWVVCAFPHCLHSLAMDSSLHQQLASACLFLSPICQSSPFPYLGVCLGEVSHQGGKVPSYSH